MLWNNFFEELKKVYFLKLATIFIVHVSQIIQNTMNSFWHIVIPLESNTITKNTFDAELGTWIIIKD